jgi:arylsulfatase
MLPMLRGEAASTHPADKIYGWELFGKKALRRGGWKIVQEPHGDFWSTHYPVEENYKWLLFNLADDPTELHDLSAENPEMLQEMLQLWDQFARKK